MAYGVLVIWNSGGQAYLESFPSGRRLECTSWDKAEEFAESMREGLVPDEAQSVNVVRFGEEPR